jgi:hypothetical protein
MSIKNFFNYILNYKCDNECEEDYVTRNIIKRIRHLSDLNKRTFKLFGRTFYIDYENEYIYSYKDHKKMIYAKDEIKDLIYILKKEQDELS